MNDFDKELIEYYELKEKIKELESKKKKIRSQIIAALGPSTEKHPLPKINKSFQIKEISKTIVTDPADFYNSWPEDMLNDIWDAISFSSEKSRKILGNSVFEKMSGIKIIKTPTLIFK